MNIQKFQKYSHEISPLYPALADKAEAISRAIENSPINVTAISDGDGILVKHIIDSLCCAEAVARYADAARSIPRRRSAVLSRKAPRARESPTSPRYAPEPRRRRGFSARSIS